MYDTEESPLSVMRVARRKSGVREAGSATETNCPGSTMNPRGGGFPTVAGTSNPAGASPSRPVVHQQGRVGCIVECDQPKGEQKGAYSLHPRQLSENHCV